MNTRALSHYSAGPSGRHQGVAPAAASPQQRTYARLLQRAGVSSSSGAATNVAAKGATPVIAAAATGAAKCPPTGASPPISFTVDLKPPAEVPSRNRLVQRRCRKVPIIQIAPALVAALAPAFRPPANSNGSGSKGGSTHATAGSPPAAPIFIDLGEDVILKLGPVPQHSYPGPKPRGAADAGAKQQQPPPQAPGGHEATSPPPAAAGAATATASAAAPEQHGYVAASEPHGSAASVQEEEAAAAEPSPLQPQSTAAVSAGAEAAAAPLHPEETRRLAVTRELRMAGDWQDVRKLLAANADCLDAVHLTAAVARLRLIAPQPGKRLVTERGRFKVFMVGFTRLCGYHLPYMPPAPLVAVLYCLAALRCPPPPDWMATWLGAADRHLQLQQGGFQPRELSNTMYALGQLGFHPGVPWLTRLCDVAAGYMGAEKGEAEAVGRGVTASGAEDKGGEVAEEQEVVVAGEKQETDVEEAAAGAMEADGRGEGLEAEEASWTVVGAATGGEDEEEEEQRAASGSKTSAAEAILAGAGPAAFTAHGLSQLAWGFARLSSLPAEPFMQTFCSETLRQLPFFTAQSLSNTLWALGSLKYTPTDPWVAQFAAACLRFMPTLSSFDLSVSLWALLRMNYSPDGGWLAGYLSAAYRCLPFAEPEHAARILWSLAKVGLVPPQHWIRMYLNATFKRLSGADPTSLTTMLWAMAELRIRPEESWSDLLVQAASDAPLRAFSSDDLVMLMWALARCNRLPPPWWMDDFWSLSYRRLPTLSPRNLSLLLWSCVSLAQAPSRQWMSGYEQVTLLHMDEQTPEGLSLIAHSYGMLEQPASRKWLQALYDASAKGGFAEFTALGLERVIWGISKLNPPRNARPSDKWIAEFMSKFVEELEEASHGNIANVLYSLASLGVRPGAAWLEAVMARVRVILGDFGHTTMGKVMWALPRLASGGSGSRRGDEVSQEQLDSWQRLVQGRMRQVTGAKWSGWRAVGLPRRKAPGVERRQGKRGQGRRD